MPTNLTGNSVNNTYDQLLHIDEGPTAVEKTVYSGIGVPTALKLGTDSASVDNIRIDGSTISTIAPDSDLVLAPNGNGTVQITKPVSFPPPAVAGSPLVRGDSVSLPNGVDLNTVVDTGFYRLGTGVVNGPAGAVVDYGQLIVSKGGDTITQIVASYSTGEMWTRSGNPPVVGGSGAWSEWLKAASPVATQAEMEAGTETAVRSMSPKSIREAFNATSSAPVYACRAWVNFDGTGTVAIRASGNVSSITDNGVGIYTVNFATPMPDANYCTCVSAPQGSNGYNITVATLSPSLPTAGSVRVNQIPTGPGGGGNTDVNNFNVAIFR